MTQAEAIGNTNRRLGERYFNDFLNFSDNSPHFFPDKTEINLSIVSMCGFISRSYLNSLDIRRLSLASSSMINSDYFDKESEQYINVFLHLYKNRFINNSFQSFIEENLSKDEKADFIRWYADAVFLVESKRKEIENLLSPKDAGHSSDILTNIDELALNLKKQGKTDREISTWNFLSTNSKNITTLIEFLNEEVTL